MGWGVRAHYILTIDFHAHMFVLSIIIMQSLYCRKTHSALSVLRFPHVRSDQSVLFPFKNGTHEFSELVLARMVLLMDQSRSVLSLRSAKAR